MRIFGPFVALATLLSLASPHVAHVHRGLAGLWIGALAIWGWSVGFSRRELRAVLSFSLLPAAVLAGLAILQFHGLYQPYAFVGVAESSRFAIGSLAGNVGDLAAALVLPVLLAQAEIARGRRVLFSRFLLVLCVYGLVVTRTFSGIAGVAAGTIVFWAFRIPRRQRALAVGGVAGALLLLALAGPFRQRSLVKVDEICPRRLERRADRETRRLAQRRSGCSSTTRSPAWGSAPFAPSSSRRKPRSSSAERSSSPNR